MCHCHLLQSSLSLKDFIAPVSALLGTLLVVAYGYHGISVQVRKNRQAKWIEEFKNHVANLIASFRSIHDLINNNRFDEEKRDKMLFDIYYRLNILKLNLNFNKSLHDKLRIQMNETMMAANGKNPENLIANIDSLENQAKELIDEFEKELNSPS